MNKKLKSKFVLFLMLLFCTGVSRAQWQPDLRLTNDPSGSFTSYTKCVAASGNDVHAVWMDWRDGNLEIYYKGSTDGGTNWGPDVRLTNDPADSEYPAISASGPVVHIIWQEKRDTNHEIYYKRSTDRGASWGPDTRLTNNLFGSWNPSVAVSGSDVHVVWYDSRDLNGEIYYKRSTDAGVSWSTDTRLTNDPGGSQYPSISVSGSSVHVVWFDNRDVNFEIYHKRSTNGGISWGSDTRLTFNSADSRFPSVSVSGSAVHVVWQDLRDVNSEIYYKCSTDDGASWGGFDIRLTSNSAYSERPSISSSGSNVHVVFENNQNTNLQIYYKNSTNGGTNWVANTRLSNTTFTSARPSVSVSGSFVHAVWHDSRNGNEDIYYKRNPLGNPVGITNISPDIPKEFTLSQNYPNPFNPVTALKYQLPRESYVTIKLYDQLGKETALLYEGNQMAGNYLLTVDGSNFASGIYYCMLSAGDYSKVIKMSLIK